jgi:hypothetical protein
MTDAEKEAIRRRANSKFWPPDTASLSNGLIALCILWQIISFFSNVGVSHIIPLGPTDGDLMNRL